MLLTVRTANFTAVFRKAHRHLLLKLFPEQQSQSLAHAGFKPGIMLVQAIQDVM